MLKYNQMSRAQRINLKKLAKEFKKTEDYIPNPLFKEDLKGLTLEEIYKGCYDEVINEDGSKLCDINIKKLIAKGGVVYYEPRGEFEEIYKSLKI